MAVTIYSGPLAPGVATAMFTKLSAEYMLRGGIALTKLADSIKKQAKINASNGKHARYTPTPATPGKGPAIISKTLVGSLDRSNVSRQVYGYLCRVGTAANRFPNYYPNVASSTYGYILEVSGLRNGSTFPFLKYAAEFGFDIVAEIIYKEAYGDKWARLL